jgi:hypothetical protein
MICVTSYSLKHGFLFRIPFATPRLPRRSPYCTPNHTNINNNQDSYLGSPVRAGAAHGGGFPFRSRFGVRPGFFFCFSRVTYVRSLVSEQTEMSEVIL